MNTHTLLESDQTSCFNERGSPIDCADSGQDGEFKPFRQNHSQRFVASDGVILDQRTGMFWHPNANLAEFPLTWEEAFEFVAGLNRIQESGRSDWRLPDRNELFSLISHQHINPALPENHPFSNVFHGYYWTRTPCARLPDEAWYIHMGGGRIYRGMQHGSYMVWPVAGDHLIRNYPKNRFVSEADTVYDQVTGKWWLHTSGAYQIPLTWGLALDQIRIRSPNDALFSNRVQGIRL